MTTKQKARELNKAKEILDSYFDKIDLGFTVDEQCFEDIKEDLEIINFTVDYMKKEILKKIDKLIPFAELDKERWNDLINEIKKEIEK